MQRSGASKGTRFSQDRNQGFYPPWFGQLHINQDRSIDFEKLEQVPSILGALDTHQDGMVRRQEFHGWMMTQPD